MQVTGSCSSTRLISPLTTKPAQYQKKTLLEKVYSFVKVILKAIVFPLNYLGSKTWSVPGIVLRLPFVLLFGWNNKASLVDQLLCKGYQFHSPKLSPKEAKPFLKHACIASSIALSPKPQHPMRMEDEWLSPLGLRVIAPSTLCSPGIEQVPGVLEANDKIFLDRSTGLKMMYVENDEEVFVTFGAAGAAKHEFPDANSNPRWKALEKKIWKKIVWSNLWGSSPAVYQQAEALYLAVKDSPALNGKKITLVGHCFGGSLAAYIGLRNRVQAVAFNTLAFGAGLQKKVGSKKLRDAHKYLTHISVERDFFSDHPKISVIDRLVNLCGIRTPGNFGRHFKVPAHVDYNRSQDGHSLSRVNQDRIHNYFVGSMMTHCGYNKRDTPKSLSARGITF